MPDAINALAAEAAAAYPGGAAYSYAAQDALTARILVVEEGGVAFPQGSGIGAPDDDMTGKWSGVMNGAGLEPGMYSGTPFPAALTARSAHRTKAGDAAI